MSEEAVTDTRLKRLGRAGPATVHPRRQPNLTRFTQPASQVRALSAWRQLAPIIMVETYSWVTKLEKLQRDCRITLEVGSQKLLLSFDDAIEFKIQIASLLESGFPSATDVCGTAAPWKAKFFPNKGGFSVVASHPFQPTASLVLDKKQTVRFSEELQDFIDEAGQRN